MGWFLLLNLFFFSVSIFLQNEFAELLNISVATLRNWEQGRLRPEDPAHVLLNVATLHSDILIGLNS